MSIEEPAFDRGRSKAAQSRTVGCAERHRKQVSREDWEVWGVELPCALGSVLRTKPLPIATCGDDMLRVPRPAGIVIELPSLPLASQGLDIECQIGTAAPAQWLSGLSGSTNGARQREVVTHGCAHYSAR